VEAGSGTGGLERLQADGSEEDLIESECPLRGVCDGEMTEVGRVEAAAEESYAHGDMLSGGWR
jgi:hypothetical protein